MHFRTCSALLSAFKTLQKAFRHITAVLQGSIACPVLPCVAQQCLSQATHKSPHLDLRVLTLLALHQLAPAAGGSRGVRSSRHQGRGCRGLCRGVDAKRPCSLVGQTIVQWASRCLAGNLPCSRCEDCQLLGCWRDVKCMQPCCQCGRRKAVSCSAFAWEDACSAATEDGRQRQTLGCLLKRILQCCDLQSLVAS